MRGEYIFLRIAICCNIFLSNERDRNKSNCKGQYLLSVMANFRLNFDCHGSRLALRDH